jgi:glycosyltransferase involved in cell wall biosynthesis
MRVLYIIDSLRPSGAEISLASLVPHLTSRGITLEIAFLADSEVSVRRQLEQAGAEVLSISASSRGGRVLEARSLVHKRCPDLIHTTLFEADIVGRTAGAIARIPVVSSLVNIAYGPAQLGDPGLSRWKVGMARVADSLTARVPVRFHALTQEVADVMGRRLHIPAQQIDVIPRGRDPDLLGRRTSYRRAKARRAMGARGDTIVVLAAGRQEFQKGLDILLDAVPAVVQEVPGVHLYISGRRGGASEKLKSLANPLKRNVTFLGHRADVPDLMCAADVFVLPSRWEGLGSVLIEAMALETPIVASDLASIREVLNTGRCGLLVPPERSQQLAAGIIDIVRRPKEAMARVRSARLRFEQFYTAERVAEQMAEFYERALRLDTRRAAGNGQLN